MAESLKKTVERRNKRLKKAKAKGERNNTLALVQKYHPEVESVVDALKPIEIVVEDRDARDSTPLSPGHCALAVACARKYDGAIIGMSVAYLIVGKAAVRYAVGQAIQREIVSFDRNKDFRSGTFVLGRPAGTRLLGVDHSSARKSRGNGKPRRVMHFTKGIRKL
jgi:hypothetical protein